MIGNSQPYTTVIDDSLPDQVAIEAKKGSGKKAE
jgi:hypothetical protein